MSGATIHRVRQLNQNRRSPGFAGVAAAVRRYRHRMRRTCQVDARRVAVPWRQPFQLACVLPFFLLPRLLRHRLVLSSGVRRTRPGCESVKRASHALHPFLAALMARAVECSPEQAPERQPAACAEPRPVLARMDGATAEAVAAQNRTLAREPTASRRPAPSQGQRTRREDRAPSHRPQMSLGRLFLDRVGRHQSPSPLHRQPGHTTHSSGGRAKGDISTLP